MRPISVDIIPSRVYLSEKDQIALFGSGYAMTIVGDLSPTGQYVCEETVEVFGKLKRGLKLRVLGPVWEQSHVEVSSVEAAYLGFDQKEVKSGDLAQAKSCRLVGPNGEVELTQGVIVPKPNLLCNPQEAEEMYIKNGQHISMEILTQTPQVLDNIVVRVHPTFQLRLELSADYARELWITKSVHARLQD
ncbi:MAG: Propanediol utilization protein [uncultured bacterium]|uniref:Phosphate propanoyltransferase n=1 Tax=Candidatus Uhrbacteria bacterium GW2011_GWC1_41_20 TaxID=1618983 RepID=A0A0G0XNB6_9BACT|nr:MAG: Propanediol utilization protein [uncultured bacterium]KKR22326.1 MAG: Phosphate propanoyltransferase [Candidatus Uhrbacteria bacterium GW2011_GWE1_39_46]KKR63540.1 MAG: Phosphate propanoyltransferase [Candidatus Uhrbacteria bacterium GW2011_GWC2_40_450]KKR89734.1 MAG: Phosphate propanoyltransferase [Candidatus Uhrbacteria bacterium GW2011_GWD2_41_121]KKR95575.1 MAG: Phosphate propanoyltransferase [Candidatus Uhrbacteria bacterium GW2011_GWD1_41_16]KKR98295.1 MAG: Phosphate propanoyltra